MSKYTSKCANLHIDSAIVFEEFVSKSARFIHKQMQSKQAQKLIVGLSGGVDSAVVARLCQIALQKHSDKDRLLCVFLPSSKTNPNSRIDAQILVEKFSLPFVQIPITKYDKLFSAQFVDSTSIEVGNFCARIRMSLLYHYSNKHQGIVVGTSNKTELLLGYGTIFGDLACAINPIGSLLKTQIFSLAHFLQIPESIIAKPPSADFYPNQSDESELGFSYTDIDALLLAISQKSAKYQPPMPIPTIHPQALRKKLYKNFDNKLVAMVLSRIKNTQFKREMPEIFLPKTSLYRHLLETKHKA